MTFTKEIKILLEEELIALKKLERIAFEKTDIILKEDLEKLEGIVRQEEELINEIGLLEVERMKTLDSWGVQSDTPLSDLIEKVVEDKEELIHIGKDMGEILEKIKVQNDLNNSIIGENLDWIDFNMNLIAGIEQPTSYGKGKNEMPQPGGNSIFDRKV